MEGEFVTLKQAKRLQAAGFPQDHWPQMTWQDNGFKDFPVSEEWLLRFEYNEFIMGHYAAPTYLRALAWMESEKAIAWGHSPEAAWYYLKAVEPVWWDSIVEQGNPADLLDAMLEYLQP